MNLWELSLRKARREDVPKILAMQVEAFTPLYRTYKDHDTSPARDTLVRMYQKFDRPGARYWFACCGNHDLGIIRIVELEGGRRCRISPIFVLPQWQNKGVAQTMLQLAERLYGKARVWELDTIMEEPGLCHLYEKAGYHRTGVCTAIQDGMTSVCYEKEV